MAEWISYLTVVKVAGAGTTLPLMTEDERFSVADFRSMLYRIGMSFPLHAVRL